MTVHALTDCNVEIREANKPIGRKVPRHSLFENNLARLSPIHSTMYKLWPFQDIVLTFAHTAVSSEAWAKLGDCKIISVYI